MSRQHDLLTEIVVNVVCKELVVVYRCLSRYVHCMSLIRRASKSAQGRRSHRSWGGVMPPPTFRGNGGRGDIIWE